MPDEIYLPKEIREEVFKLSESLGIPPESVVAQVWKEMQATLKHLAKLVRTRNTQALVDD